MFSNRAEVGPPVLACVLPDVPIVGHLSALASIVSRVLR